jgi:hypothetical protein
MRPACQAAQGGGNQDATGADMKQFGILALAGLLAAVPAAATVTFQGVSLYAGTHTNVGAIYTPQTIETTLGDYSLRNDNGLGPGNLGGSNTSFVSTLMQVVTHPYGTSFQISAKAQVDWTGFPAYLNPSADSDNQFHYYFTTDAPFDLQMTYAMPALYSVTSDYYTVGGRFTGIFVQGGTAADRSDSGSLFNMSRNPSESDADKNIYWHLPAGVYTLTVYGGVYAQTYHPGNVSVLVPQMTLATNLNPIASVPEPASWALLITGFGLCGAALRRRRVYQGSVSPL